MESKKYRENIKIRRLVIKYLSEDIGHLLLISFLSNFVRKEGLIVSCLRYLVFILQIKILSYPTAPESSQCSPVPIDNWTYDLFSLINIETEKKKKDEKILNKFEE